jgi:N-methylhydantoinase A
MPTRIGVDIGGTFSDLIYVDDATGEVGVAKGPSTPAAPHEGVVGVVRDEVGRDVVERASLFLHGSTVALNALLERRGARVGLITTAGFRDVLELRRGERAAINDVRWKAPEPLIPRRLRLEVGERVLADGSIDTPLAAADVERAARTLIDAGVECAAVVLINAWVNPEHELRVEELLRAADFDGAVSLSHRVSGEYREFERTSTAAIDAYIRPRMSTYLAALRERIGAMGFAGECLITSSGGGAVPFAEAERRPFEHIQSGPVAGAVAAGDLCRALGLARAVTADVGGTSFDTCLIVDGQPELQYEGRVIDMPVQAPWVDVRSIGAGGGSLVTVDPAGRLQVGPRSAGADPGPACYGRGGVEPTVTDAALLLGMLGPGLLAGGLRLDAAAARAAYAPVAERLGLAIDDVARGVLTIAATNMANAVRQITLERGEDPRGAALLAFGGAGPLLAGLLATELDMELTVVPPHAGNFSAWGLLVQDLARGASATLVRPLADDALPAVTATLAALFADLRARGAGVAEAGEPVLEAVLDVRFSGQEYTLSVPVALAADGALRESAEEIRSAFVERHRRTFGHAQDEACELVTVRATMRVPLPAPSAGGTAAVLPGDAPGSAEAFSFALGRRTEFALADRAALAPGRTLAGPAIVVEPTSTTYVDAYVTVEVDDTGTLLLRRRR